MGLFIYAVITLFFGMVVPLFHPKTRVIVLPIWVKWVGYGWLICRRVYVRCRGSKLQAEDSINQQFKPCQDAVEMICSTIAEVDTTPAKKGKEPASPSPTWMKDDETKCCLHCGVKFTLFTRRHHCRFCKKIFCNACSSDKYLGKRICLECYSEKTHRKREDSKLLELESKVNSENSKASALQLMEDKWALVNDVPSLITWFDEESSRMVQFHLDDKLFLAENISTFMINVLQPEGTETKDNDQKKGSNNSNSSSNNDINTTTTTTTTTNSTTTANSTNNNNNNKNNSNNNKKKKASPSKIAGFFSSGNSAALEKEKERLYQQHISSGLVKKITHQTQEARLFMEELDSDDGWRIVRESSGVKTMYRSEEGSDRHSFKVSGVVESPVDKIAACLYEIDLYTNWFPFLKNAKELMGISRFHKICWVELGFPWPFENREIVMDGYGIDFSENNRVLVNVHSIQSHPLCDIPPPQEGNTRADMQIGGFLLEPVTRKACRVSFMMNVDPKVDVAPAWLLNTISSKLVHFILMRIRKATKFDDKSEYAERMKANPQVYAYIREQAEAFWQQHAHEFPEE